MTSVLVEIYNSALKISIKLFSFPFKIIGFKAAYSVVKPWNQLQLCLVILTHLCNSHHGPNHWEGWQNGEHVAYNLWSNLKLKEGSSQKLQFLNIFTIEFVLHTYFSSCNSLLHIFPIFFLILRQKGETEAKTKKHWSNTLESY